MEAFPDFARPAADLLAATLAFSDARWDPGLHLYSDLSSGLAVGRVRETAPYALGLFARDHKGDRERAIAGLEAVLSYQWNAPGRPYHGSFARNPAEPEPGVEAKMWQDYDPNWREFIGLTLEVILRHYSDKLPPALISRIESALRLAAEGSLARNVSAHYTNIALMASFLLDTAGVRLGEPAWQKRGTALCAEIEALFDRNGTFEEFNSPTYYGVDLMALASLRKLAHDPATRRSGAAMEQSLWAEMARNYHAGLQNFCGPYDRAYGMDLRSYMAFGAQWVALVTGFENAPLPKLDASLDHSHDAIWGCIVSHLGLPELPNAVRQAFVRWPGPSEPRFVISSDPLRETTAVIRERWMMGGDSLPGRVWYQKHAGTIHWRLTAEHGGGIGWLKVEPEENLSVSARDRTLHIGFSDGQSRPVIISFFCPPSTAGDLREGKLAGIQLSYSAPAVSHEASQDVPALTRLCWAALPRLLVRVIE